MHKNEKRAKVMIVDDTAANLMLLDNMLRNQGYNVFSFPRGDLALKGVGKNPPDLILLDINMPGMNGFDVCEHLKSDDRFKEIPVIFISALNETMDKVKAFNVGGIDYITKPFQFEEVIARVKTHLKLRQYQKQLLEAKKEAEKITQVKSEFLANMSHEIRTPMNAVLGFLELVLEDSSLRELHRQHLSTAHLSAVQLLGLINDILDLSKLESGKMIVQQRPFNLSMLMQGICETLDIKAREKDLELRLDIHPSLSESFIGDPLRIRQIVVNLVGNAIKFTEQGNVITRIMPADQEGQLYFVIEDTGIGMPPDKVTQIFEPFVQTDSSPTRQFEGTGLGTSISRRLVELMGGRIWAESEEGKGSTFHFKINMAPTDQIPEDNDLFIVPGKAVLPSTRRHFRILLAEDNEANVDLAKYRLEQQGHGITVAWNGREAVEAFIDEKIDVILMDIQMPEMGGVEATKRIRTLEADKGGHVPIIAMTASVMKEETEKYLEVGIDAIVAKPTNFNKVFKVMEALVPEGVGEVFVEDTKDVDSKIPDLESQELLPDDLTGINIKDALNRVAGNRGLLKKLLRKFSLRQRNVIEEIESAITSKDRETAIRLAHTLKGTSGNLGAQELHKAAANLETAIKAGKKELKSLISHVSDNLQVVFSSIGALGQIKAEEFTAATVSVDAVDISKGVPLLDELKTLLEEDSTDAVRKLYQIKEAFKGSAVQGELDTMEESLGGYDFEQALEVLSKVRKQLCIGKTHAEGKN
ncbi:response regulator [Thermodesulfobacteriota bacterium]